MFKACCFLTLPPSHWQNASAPSKSWTLTVSGATVRAPYFVAGKTKLADWKASIRKAPAPWAELQTDNFILTVPSSAVRKLDNPDALMAWWNRVVDAEADLAAIPRARPRPERMVLDVDISVGMFALNRYCHEILRSEDVG